MTHPRARTVAAVALLVAGYGLLLPALAAAAWLGTDPEQAAAWLSTWAVAGGALAALCVQLSLPSRRQVAS